MSHQKKGFPYWPYEPSDLPYTGAPWNTAPSQQPPADRKRAAELRKFKAEQEIEAAEQEIQDAEKAEQEQEAEQEK